MILTALAVGSPASAQGNFRRADANGDATVDISDALFILGYLFVGSEEPACLDAADSNDDGIVDISDATHALGFLFLGSETPPSPGPVSPGPDPTDDSLSCGAGTGGPARTYVTSRLAFPATQQEAVLLGFDLDGDPEGRSDNGLGRVFVVLLQQGLDLQAMLQATFGAGRIVMLHRLEADDLNETAAASWRTLIGEDVAAPIDLSGAGEFLVAPGAPPGAQVSGRIAAGRFTGGPGAVQIEISLHPSVPLVLDLAGARIEADVSEAGCRNGRIGGGITQEAIDGALIPGLAATLQAMVEDDPAGDLASRLLDFFDGDDDGRITVEELRESSIIATLLAPDVDLFDETGAFRPLTDGVRDSLSFALGFECVGASFSLPE